MGAALPAHADMPEGNDSETNPKAPGLVLPPVDTGFREYIALVDETLAGAEEYSAVRILRDRTGAEIYWDGEPSASLEQLLSAAPEGFSVRIVDTPYNPAELRAEVDRLIRTDGVLSVHATPEADSLVVTLDSETPRAKSGASALSKFPVTIEDGKPVPADRFDEPLPFGGSTVTIQNAGGCTTAFAATTVGGAARMLTAAHCGLNGAAVTQRQSGTALGTILGRNITHDAASIGGGSGLSYSIPYVWSGDGLLGDSLITVDGTINPVVGDEICLSGSYSGYSCGHIVEAATTWNLANPQFVPPMSGITGYRTHHEGNQYLNGKGDSGGPGIIWTASGATTLSYAATLTSGIVDSVGPGYCDNVFGYNPFDTANRVCSDKSLLTSARSAASAFGLSITTF